MTAGTLNLRLLYQKEYDRMLITDSNQKYYMPMKIF